MFCLAWGVCTRTPASSCAFRHCAWCPCSRETPCCGCIPSSLMQIDESCNDINLVDVYRRFGRTCGYHLRSRGVSLCKMLQFRLGTCTSSCHFAGCRVSTCCVLTLWLLLTGTVHSCVPTAGRDGRSPWAARIGMRVCTSYLRNRCTSLKDKNGS
jgi:hypothetical protein